METDQTPISSAPRTSGLAIASLVTGLTCVAPLAIIFGHMAMSRIIKSAEQQTGYRMALAGTILGYVGLMVWSLSIFIQPVEFDEYPDRTVCILQARNIQQAVRTDQNLSNRKIGDPINWSDIVGPDKLLERKPVCPSGGTYTFSKVYPEPGQLACTCSHADHVPRDHRTW